MVDEERDAAPDLESVPTQPGLWLWQGDICKLRADVIVNAANLQMLGCFLPHHRCIDNVIHAAAGPELRASCHALMSSAGRTSVATAEPLLTPAFALPARFVCHVTGPNLTPRRDPTAADERALAASYRNVLALAAGHAEREGLRSVAFCAISTGEFGYPPRAAAAVALRELARWAATGRDPAVVVVNTFTPRDTEAYAEAWREVMGEDPPAWPGRGR